MPKTMPQETAAFLSHIHDDLILSKPTSVDLAIAIPSTNLRWPHTYTDLLVFGSFRSHYELIERMAKLLYRELLQYSILPRIHPFNREDMKALSGDAALMRTVKQSGMIVFYQRKS
jgi:hypothetical protein